MDYGDTLENAVEGLDEIENLVMYDSDDNPVGIAVDSTPAGGTKYNRSKAKILNLFTGKSELDVFRALQKDSFESNELVDEEHMKELEKEYF